MKTNLNRASGYTLIEMLIALIMFAFISAATGFALTAGIRGQQSITNRNDDLTEARTLLAIISRDLRCAYASSGNLYTFFVASGSTTGTLLTFTSAVNYIRSASPGTSAQSTDTPNYGPQSDVGIVNYSFDSTQRTLSRSVTPMPNTDVIPDPNDPSTIISHHVRSIAFAYIDPNTGTRSEWNFMVDPSASSSTTQGQQGQQGPQQSQQQAQPQNGDTTLPAAVQVSLELDSASGVPITYSTTVNLMTPQPQPVGQKPPPATTTTTTDRPPGGTPQRPPGGSPPVTERPLPTIQGMGVRP